MFPTARFRLDGLGRRLVVLAAFVLAYLLVLEVSVEAGLSDRPLWGIAAQVRPDGRSVVTWVEPNGPAWGLGLQVGDLLITSLSDGADPPGLPLPNTAPQLHATRPDGSAPLTLRWPERAGHGVVGTFSAPIISAFFVVAGGLVFVRATGRRQALAFAVLCALAALQLASVPAGLVGRPWAIRLAFASVPLTAAAFAWFFLVFPVDRLARGVIGRALGVAVLALPIVSLALYVVVLTGRAELFVWNERVAYVSMVLGFGAGLALLLRAYYEDCPARVRQQLQIAVGGTVLGVVPFLALSVLPKALVGDQEMTLRAPGFVVAPELTVLGTVLIPLSFGYAILKHQLIEADVYVRRGVVYLAFTIAATVCYLLTISLFVAVLQRATGGASTSALVAAALAVALAADPIRRGTEAFVERVFFSDIRAYRRLLDASGLSLDTILSPEELMPLIVGTVAAALPIDRLAVLIADRDGAGYQVRWDEWGDRADGLTLDAGHWALRRVAAEGRPVFLDSPLILQRSGAPEQCSASTGRGGPSSAPLEARLLVPLKTGGRVIALLALADRADGEPFSGADLEFLGLVARRYAVALDNALLHETVRRQADTDPLTGVYNHRFLLSRLSAETAAAQQTGQPLAVLMMDVDSFKFFNDTYGHPAGDQVLISTTRALRDVCRPGDVFGRYGGDEFVAILPNTDRAAASQIANRISEAAQRLTFQVDGGGPMALSVSVGVAVAPEDGDSPLQLISAADVAMYRRKHSDAHTSKTLPDLVDLPSPALRALILAIEQKDGYVAAHCERTAYWAVRLAVALHRPERERQVLRIAGLLHDVGKLGISERILNKADPLTPEERAIVMQHVDLGVRLINDVPYLDEVVEAVASHHERWDGLGYPRGLKGDETPLGGRILAVADVYSAMTTDRPYRPRLTQEEAASRLRRQAGTQLDPEIVSVFLSLLASVDGIVFGPGEPAPDRLPGRDSSDLAALGKPLRITPSL